MKTPRLIQFVALACLLQGAAFAGEITIERLKDLRTEPKKLDYKTVGNVKLQIHVYAPEGVPPGEKRPAIVMIHGGGWAAEGTFHLAPHCRYFALRGLVAVNVEYRLVVNKENPVRIPDCVVDCRDALRFVRKNAAELGIDPDRIAVAGESAGGHLAAALGMLPDPDEGKDGVVSARPNAMLLYNPVVDLVAIKWMPGHAGVAALPDSPKDETWEARARLTSPIQYVRKGLPPTLLIHGAADSCVPVEQVDRFAKAMKDAGNKIEYQRKDGWDHAFLIPNYGKDTQIVESLCLTDKFLAGLGWVQGEPTISAGWRPPEFHSLFTEEERSKPYVRARSFSLYDWPFLDGQWEGIICDSDGNVWFSVSTHSGTQHAQLFRYDVKADRVDHVADLGQACGETLTGNPPQDKIHGQMFEDTEFIYAGTCEGHAIADKPYKGGYWLRIDKKTGVVTNLLKKPAPNGLLCSMSEDGLLCVGFDPWRKILYGNTNRKGWLVSLNPTTGEEKNLGVPWQDAIDAWKADASKDKPKEIWPRSLTLMITEDGKVYGCKPPACTFWCYDPAVGKIENIEVKMPLPDDVAAGDSAAVARWKGSSIHLTLWDEKDKCFYFIRSHDEMLCRFFPPKGAAAGRVEPLQVMGLKEHRFNNHLASCTLVMLGRTIYYTPYTGWGGTVNLQSYDLEGPPPSQLSDFKKFNDYGPIIVEGSRRLNESHSLAAGKDGKLYLVAFVFSIEGKDPVNPWGMRDKYPFHPRFVIIDPKADTKKP